MCVNQSICLYICGCISTVCLSVFLSLYDSVCLSVCGNLGTAIELIKGMGWDGVISYLPVTTTFPPLINFPWNKKIYSLYSTGGNIQGGTKRLTIFYNAMFKNPSPPLVIAIKPFWYIICNLFNCRDTD